MVCLYAYRRVPRDASPFAVGREGGEEGVAGLFGNLAVYHGDSADPAVGGRPCPRHLRPFRHSKCGPISSLGRGQLERLRGLLLCQRLYRLLAAGVVFPQVRGRIVLEEDALHRHSRFPRRIRALLGGLPQPGLGRLSRRLSGGRPCRPCRTLGGTVAQRYLRRGAYEHRLDPSLPQDQGGEPLLQEGTAPRFPGELRDVSVPYAPVGAGFCLAAHDAWLGRERRAGHLDRKSTK